MSTDEMEARAREWAGANRVPNSGASVRDMAAFARQEVERAEADYRETIRLAEESHADSIRKWNAQEIRADDLEVARDAALADAARLHEAGNDLCSAMKLDDTSIDFRAQTTIYMAALKLRKALSARDSAAWLKRKLDEARAEERERAAKALEMWAAKDECQQPIMARIIAEMIRARSDGEDGR